MHEVWRILVTTVLLITGAAEIRADWTTLRGNPQHTGYVPGALPERWNPAWIRHFPGERLGSAMEPIVADNRVFIATHSGNLYALDARDGKPLWRFQTRAPFLHSPAYAGGILVAGSTDGRLYGLDARAGRLRWSLDAGRGGFSAAPVIAESRVLIGSRAGDFHAVDIRSGRRLWRRALGAPIRQSAAIAGNRVFVTSEDMRVHCMEQTTGRALWISEPLIGQTARDYYPVVVQTRGRACVIVRTNPLHNMAERISRDRSMLARNAGVDDSDWKTLDAWIKSPQAVGSPPQYEREQQAIVRYLQQNRDARSFFVLDADTGRELFTAPVLWAAGCQAVGIMPAVTGDGRLLVFYRSAYGNWNLGVAPLVAPGLLDLASRRISPLRHRHGAQPPWNAFWGTADESQNFTVVGETALIVHQSTLSALDIRSGTIRVVWGERDTYGGLPAPAWARNEWHGPGRGSVAYSDRRIYWITGSRILCLSPGEGKTAEVAAFPANQVPATRAPQPPPLTEATLKSALNRSLSEILQRRWSPLRVEPGLAGSDYAFDHSGDLFEALAWCYPHLEPKLRERAKGYLADEWSRHPPFTPEAWYSLDSGTRREFFPTEGIARARSGADTPPHPFGNLYAAVLYAERCGEWPRVVRSWQQIRQSYEAFAATGWRLDGAKGDLYANRYLASLIALARVAERVGDRETALKAKRQADQTEEALAAWWRRAAEEKIGSFRGVSELDRFIGQGDALSFRIAPHRHKIALLRNLTPEVAQRIRSREPEAVERVWQRFETLYRTWFLVGEERQVHFGENFVDPPDLAMSGFQGMKWLRRVSSPALSRRIDLPFCRADLYYLMKLALCLER
jgi:outer membrane protein assembly factor BamB